MEGGELQYIKKHPITPTVLQIFTRETNAAATSAMQLPFYRHLSVCLPHYMKTNRKPIASNKHMAWLTALAGALTLATLMGIGRFSYTPVLPMMLHDRIITLFQGGSIATLHYIGYFVGAGICMIWRFPTVTMIRSGLLLTIVCTFGMGLTNQVWALFLLRLVVGLATGWGFVNTSAWFLQRFNTLGYPAMAGFIFCGPGMGILITGLSASGMIFYDWHANTAWFIFGVLAIAMTIVCWPIFKPLPQTETTADTDNTPNKHAAIWKYEPFWQSISYGMSGLGYIITATFLPVIARIAIPNSDFLDLFWPLFGLCVAIGAMLSTRIPSTYDQRLLLTVFYVMQALGVFACMYIPTEAGFALSSILLGLPFTAISFFGMREARRIGYKNPARLIAIIVTTYSFGQIIGPPIATHFVTATGSFHLALFVAALALIIGAVIYAGLVVRDHYQHS
jgi:MFS family permease